MMQTLFLFILLLTAASCCWAGSFIKYETAADFAGLSMSHARWDASSGCVVFDPSAPGESPGAILRGVVESPEVDIPEGFNQLVVSWNAFTPPKGYLVFYVRARVDGSWTGWYNMGLWSRNDGALLRTSFKKQKDSFGTVDTDTLILEKSADAYKFRVELSSEDAQAYPMLRFLGVHVLDTTVQDAGSPIENLAWGKELDVPELCQLSVPGGEGWCSPTSTAMVLGYWSKVLNRPELKLGITETARSVHDKSWGGTGNWVFNTAFAGEFPGIRAYVTRFTNTSQIEQWIARGVPVIVSVNTIKIYRPDEPGRNGHLMVVRGFTPEGDPVINDPWAHLEKGQTVREVFKRGDLERGWLGENGSYGTVYLIYPENMRF